jgi:hypothetical protein
MESCSKRHNRHRNLTNATSREQWSDVFADLTFRHGSEVGSVWSKISNAMRQSHDRDAGYMELVGWMFTLSAAAYNLIRIRNLALAVQ